MEQSKSPYEWRTSRTQSLKGSGENTKNVVVGATTKIELDPDRIIAATGYSTIEEVIEQSFAIADERLSLWMLVAQLIWDGTETYPEGYDPQQFFRDKKNNIIITDPVVSVWGKIFDQSGRTFELTINDYSNPHIMFKIAQRGLAMYDNYTQSWHEVDGQVVDLDIWNAPTYSRVEKEYTNKNSNSGKSSNSGWGNSNSNNSGNGGWGNRQSKSNNNGGGFGNRNQSNGGFGNNRNQNVAPTECNSINDVKAMALDTPFIAPIYGIMTSPGTGGKIYANVYLYQPDGQSPADGKGEQIWFGVEDNQAVANFAQSKGYSLQGEQTHELNGSAKVQAVKKLSKNKKLYYSDIRLIFE